MVIPSWRPDPVHLLSSAFDICHRSSTTDFGIPTLPGFNGQQYSGAERNAGHHSQCIRLAFCFCGYNTRAALYEMIVVSSTQIRTFLLLRPVCEVDHHQAVPSSPAHTREEAQFTPSLPTMHDMINSKTMHIEDRWWERGLPSTPYIRTWPTSHFACPGWTYSPDSGTLELAKYFRPASCQAF
jgi:hypothetical protein